MLEISGKRRDLESGYNFLFRVGIDVHPLAQELNW